MTHAGLNLTSPHDLRAFARLLPHTTAAITPPAYLQCYQHLAFAAAAFRQPLCGGEVSSSNQPILCVPTFDQSAAQEQSNSTHVLLSL